MALFNKKPAANKKPEPEKRQETAAGTGPKEVQPVKKKRKMRYLLLYIAAIGFAFYAVITIINQNVKIAEKRAELSELRRGALGLYGKNRQGGAWLCRRGRANLHQRRRRLG